jgi:predicted metal-binding protein
MISMVKVGILICDRNRTCTGNKCYRSIIERDGVFSEYKNESIEVVGWMACGGCPGERLEFAPADMKKYGAEVIFLASCYLAGYPPCPYIKDHKTYIENYVGLPVVIGTHPMPQNYIDTHTEAGDWEGLEDYLAEIINDPDGAYKYDSTRPDYSDSLNK